jgi:hypothetical protein
MLHTYSRFSQHDHMDMDMDGWIGHTILSIHIRMDGYPLDNSKNAYLSIHPFTILSTFITEELTELIDNATFLNQDEKKDIYKENVKVFLPLLKN